MNVGREQVHVVESGPPDGVPLLLTSGLGGAWFDWAPAVALLRDRYRVTVFDRPGLGLSPAAAARPTLRRDTAILAALAERAGPPVIVLAHSMAAFHAEALARLRPGLVRGMVLADPSHERGPRTEVARILDPHSVAGVEQQPCGQIQCLLGARDDDDLLSGTTDPTRGREVRGDRVPQGRETGRVVIGHVVQQGVPRSAAPQACP